MISNELAALLARDLARLVQELKAFPDDASLWRIVPGVTNSAGNLALHLEGNLREYVGRQLGGVDFKRDRPSEFSKRDLARHDLVTRIEAVHELVPRVVEGLSELALSATYPEEVLGIPITTRQFLIHLAGHLNYHLGQIDYLRRMTTGDGAIKLVSL